MLNHRPFGEIEIDNVFGGDPGLLVADPMFVLSMDVSVLSMDSITDTASASVMSLMGFQKNSLDGVGGWS